MKTKAILLLILFLTGGLYSASAQEMQTLINGNVRHGGFGAPVVITPIYGQETETLLSGEIRHGGFGALVYGATSVNGQFSYVRGSRWAWVINMNDRHSLSLGFAGYRTHTEFEPEGWNNLEINEPDLKTNYNGFEIEYTNRSNKLVHAGVQALVGRGRVRYVDPEPMLSEASDKYFVFQPGINLNVNVTNWFRLSGGVYYRFASGVDLDGTSDTNLSGVLSFIGLKFGKF